MSRAELAALLVDLVRRKVLTETEAAQVLVAFGRGDLGVLDDLPGAPEADEQDWLAALALLLLLMGGSPRRRIAPQRRVRARNLLRGRFQTATAQLARGVTNGALTVAAWQVGMQAALATYTRQMAVAGAGGLPSAGTRAAVDARLAEQWPFLERFAVTLALRAEVDRPLSPGYVTNRARQYGGSAWGAFFVAQGAGAAPGMVEQWVTRDDNAVCRLCAPRHLQYYLPGQGPMPGDCLGICRCVRVQVLAPDIYARLTGQRQRRAA